MKNTENHLIELLPKQVKKRFLALCEPFELVHSATLEVRGAQLTHAYFPRSGSISMVLDVQDHPSVELGMVGREAMLGSELVLGLAKTPWRSVVVGAGGCWRIETTRLRQALIDMQELENLLKRALMVRLHQLSLASTCQYFHPIDQRLARWLLMSLDRAQSEELHITQELISQMLGVRRASVTLAASDFQKDGLIEYHRGELKVIDRERLERAACSCYEADKLLLTKLMAMKA